MKSEIGKIGGEEKITATIGAPSGEKIELVGDMGKDVMNLIISKGTPAIYG